jgi:uncharacterized delta-60 repeat protein
LVTIPVGPGDDWGQAVRLQSDGSIVVAGFSSNGVNYDFAVARLNSIFRLDTAFDTDGIVTTAIGSTDIGDGLAIQADGKLLVAGYAILGNDDFALARYNTNGSLDTSFDADGIVTTPILASFDLGTEALIQPDGKIVVAGYAWNGVDFDFALARYDSSGALDTSFDGDGKLTTAIGSSHDRILDAALQPDGKIVVSAATHNGANLDVAVLRYDANGSLDPSFDGDGIATTAVGAGDDRGLAVALQSDGKIVVAGDAVTGASTDFVLVRYTPGGSLDTSFDADGKVTTSLNSGDDVATDVVIQSNGRIVVAGRSHNGANFDFALARYDGSGSLDQSCDTRMRVKSGFYVGTGVNGRPITGLGFQPDVVIVKADFDQNGVIRTSTMTGNVSRSLFVGLYPLPDRIQSLDADGFTVGNTAPGVPDEENPQLNAPGVTYYWVAFRSAPGEMKVGTYVGNDADDRTSRVSASGRTTCFFFPSKATGRGTATPAWSATPLAPWRPALLSRELARTASRLSNPTASRSETTSTSTTEAPRPGTTTSLGKPSPGGSKSAPTPETEAPARRSREWDSCRST